MSEGSEGAEIEKVRLILPPRRESPPTPIGTKTRLRLPPKRMERMRPIEETTGPVTDREDLVGRVEGSLLTACQEFFDKNIKTIGSSANYKDIAGGGGYITIDFGSLSPENQTIALGLGTLRRKEGRGENQLDIKVPFDGSTTVEEVRRRAEALAHLFQPQEMLWAPTLTPEEIGIREVTPEILQRLKGAKDESANYHYDPEKKVFYLNEEDYLRTHPTHPGKLRLTRPKTR